MLIFANEKNMEEIYTITYILDNKEEIVLLLEASQLIS